MISVIIPTHNPKHLKEAVHSVLGQTQNDFEIVLVPNNGARIDTGAAPFDDPRIRIVEYDGPQSIGAIKRFGFRAAKGEILVELDHDDLLTPNALEEIGKTFGDNGCGFVYSDFARFAEPGLRVLPYLESHGWKSQRMKLMNRDVIASEAFEPSPATFSSILFAPNHVRAWTKETYERVGGHDPARAICDDFDLVVRSFLGAPIKRIPKVLYLYRECGAGQSYSTRIKEINKLSWQIYGSTVEQVVLKWCQTKNLPAFDLGGALNPRKNWTSVDRQDAEVCADLSNPWPWKDSSVGAFRAYDFLEHLPDKLFTMQQIHRCLAPGGILISLTPSSSGMGADMDPTHVSRWNKGSFWYWTKKDFAAYIRNESVRFQTLRLVEDFPSSWHRENNIPYVTFDGVALKEGYEGPGKKDI